MHGLSQSDSLLSLDVAAKILTMGMQQLAELIESGRVEAIITPSGCFLEVETVNELYQQRRQLEAGAGANPRTEPPHANWRGAGASAGWLSPLPARG